MFFLAFPTKTKRKQLIPGPFPGKTNFGCTFFVTPCLCQLQSRYQGFGAITISSLEKLAKIAITNQKIDFWPQISKFWGKKSTFSPLAANWSLADQCFQHEKGVSLESRYEGTKIFAPCPQKIGFWTKFGRFWAQNPIFWGQGVKILVPSYQDSNETPFSC